jgi:hypothetical protein
VTPDHDPNEAEQPTRRNRRDVLGAVLHTGKVSTCLRGART